MPHVRLIAEPRVLGCDAPLQTGEALATLYGVGIQYRVFTFAHTARFGGRGRNGEGEEDGGHSGGGRSRSGSLFGGGCCPWPSGCSPSSCRFLLCGFLSF